MIKFQEVLKQARKSKKKTLREVYEDTKISVSYLSDMEQGRRIPTDLELIQKIEVSLNIGEGELVKAAKREKDMDVPSDAKEIFWQRPVTMLALLRASQDYTEEQINDFLAKMRKSSRKQEVF